MALSASESSNSAGGVDAVTTGSTVYSVTTSSTGVTESFSAGGVNAVTTGSTVYSVTTSSTGVTESFSAGGTVYSVSAI